MTSSYKPPQFRSAREFRGRVLFFYFAAAALAFTVLLSMAPTRVRTAELDIDLLLSVFGPLMAIAAFMERALEVFVTGLRGGETQRIERALESETDPEQEEEIREALEEYRHRTRRITFVIAVSVGLMISTLGVRSLEPFLVVDAMKQMAAWQASWLSAIDVAITAALLGGGSDGIHKLVKLVTDYLDEASLNVRHQGRANRSLVDTPN